ncbi:unnamed protein product [Urochloa humidicola]
MTIRSGSLVESFGFSYVNRTGSKIIAGPVGGTGGQLTTIQFAPTEWVTKLSGTLEIRSVGSGVKPVVASLEIETNIKKYGPYGGVHQDYSFSMPVPEGWIITGFFGRAGPGSLIDAIGVYIGLNGPETTRLDAITVATDEETSGN